MIFTNIIFQQSLYPAQNFFADFGCLLTLPAMGSVVQAISHSTQNVHKEHTANTQQQQCALSHTDTHTLSHTQHTHTHTNTHIYTHTCTHTHSHIHSHTQTVWCLNRPGKLGNLVSSLTHIKCVSIKKSYHWHQHKSRA